MAQLVAVCRSDDYPFERRQIPLVVDETLTMVIQFNDTCIGCEHVGIKQKELERFVQKFSALTKDEIAVALMVTNKEIFNLLSQMVPCVGCRRSVERLFSQLVDSGHPAVEPLIITRSSYMSIKRNFLFDPKAIYALFYVHGSKLNSMMDSIPKSKKNKRCALHSLDTHKAKSLGSWMDMWDVLSQECREEVVLIECEGLLDTLENYLRKHRFCSECKSKVLRAYNILVGDLDCSAEKGYCPALYDGLRCCPGERHIHVLCKTDFIAHLIGRAEPELVGSSRRERHAKTLDIAQEEVLTCLGIHLYERLHRIWQKLRAEEQTWQILFYLGVDALKKSFEMALEKKQGISNLELMCEELLEEERAREQKREQKRQKRKKKKNKNKQDPEDNDLEKNKENCKCDDNTSTASCKSCDHNTYKSCDNNTRKSCDNSCTSCDSNTRKSCDGNTYKSCTGNTCKSFDNNANEKPANVVRPHHVDSCTCDPQIAPLRHNTDVGSTGSRSDCGYSSGVEGCDTCSMPSSNDGSDIACSEGLCNHDGDAALCSRGDITDECVDCSTTKCDTRERWAKSWGSKCDGGRSLNPTVNDVHCDYPTYMHKYRMTLSLQDMLEASCSSDEDADVISEEEIQRFKANQTHLNTQRQELREMLRQRFANLQQQSGACCYHAQPFD